MGEGYSCPWPLGFFQSIRAQLYATTGHGGYGSECAFMLSTSKYLAFLGLYVKLLKGIHLRALGRLYLSCGQL